MWKHFALCLACSAIIVMDVAAGMLAIQAEIDQNKVRESNMGRLECKYTSTTALRLGLAAIALLFGAHITVNLLGGCVCIRSKHELETAPHNKRFATATLILSWIMLGLAVSMLITGVLGNSKARERCPIVHHHLLSTGGIICFFHGFFSVCYYISIAVTFN